MGETSRREGRTGSTGRKRGESWYAPSTTPWWPRAAVGVPALAAAAAATASAAAAGCSTAAALSWCAGPGSSSAMRLCVAIGVVQPEPPVGEVV